MEEFENKYKMYISAYQAIESLDEYELKVYILEELKEYIAEYKETNEIELDFNQTYNEIEKDSKLIKLQDALFTINELNGPIDLIHLIQNRVKSYKEDK